MYLPAGISGLCMWEGTKGKSGDQKTDITGGKGAGGKQPLQKRKASGV